MCSQKRNYHHTHRAQKYKPLFGKFYDIHEHLTTKVNFTFYRDNYKARLDRIYINKNDIQKILKYNIIPSAFNDHDAIEIYIRFGERTKWGNGSWSLNCKLLEDDHFIRDIETSIELYKINKQINNNPDQWDKLKAQIKRLAIQRSIMTK